MSLFSVLRRLLALALLAALFLSRVPTVPAEERLERALRSAYTDRVARRRARRLLSGDAPDPGLYAEVLGDLSDKSKADVLRVFDACGFHFSPMPAACWSSARALHG